MEILTFHVRLYMSLSRFATTSEVMAMADMEDSLVSADGIAKIKGRILPEIREDCEAAGFDLAVEEINRAIAATETGDFLRHMVQVHSRIYDYLNSRTVLVIPPKQGARYESPLSGWETCCEKFPAVIDHIEEASRSISLGRNTACVFHLMAVAQEALEAISKRLAVPLDPNSDTWNGLIGKIEKAMKAKSEAMPKKKWKAIEPFYAEIVSDLKAMKNAWRNPTMHFRRTYTDMQAEKVYQRVQEFMIHASTKLHGGKRV